MHIKIIFLLIYFLFSTFSCTTTKYNTPFIDIYDSAKLQFGMNRQEVLQTLNEPLYISYGKKDTIIWVYEVRAIKINSKMTYGKITPTKNTDSFSHMRHSPPIHKLSLIFKRGKLSSWNTIHE